MPDDNGNGAIRSRAIWSGTITFGLVSVPVNLFPGNRPQRVSLRMLDEDGTPLVRRYLCPAEDREIGPDDVARGYELDDGKFVIIEDDELEAIEPRKSRDIDLRQFVPVEQVDPIFFERAYFLAPDGSNKAYRLLAESMEELGRAGIATFVMRDREYLVAIIAENGILRAETLRFSDELRAPKDVDLPKPASASDTVVRRIARDIEKHSGARLSRTALKDRHAEQLIALAERKRKRHEDVIEIPEEIEEEEEGTAIIDLVEILRRSMTEREARGRKAAAHGARKAATHGARKAANSRRGGAANGRRKAAESNGTSATAKKRTTAGAATRKVGAGTAKKKSTASKAAPKKRSAARSAGKNSPGTSAGKRSTGKAAARKGITRRTAERRNA